MLRKLFIILINISLLVFGSNAIAVEKTDQFPKRKFYPHLNYIDTLEFAHGIKTGRFEVIDVRDNISYKALHVEVARNIVLTSDTFEQDILEFARQTDKPLAIYCNGISCSKSYIASTKVRDAFKKHKIAKEVFTYDSGINAIAYAFNELVLKDGKPISKENPLISAEQIQKHSMEPEKFEHYITWHNDKEFAILDIREKEEKIINKLFMFRDVNNISLSQRDDLIAFLNTVKSSHKTLLVYDASGRQIDGIYELLRIIEIDQWHYLEGGEYGYSKYAIKAVAL